MSSASGHEVDFWDLALRHSLAKQMVAAFDEAPDWVLLLLEDPEGLVDTIMSLHNLSFGQIGALAFAMEGFGMDSDGVKRRVMQMAVAEQLSEELVRQHEYK